MACVLNHVWSRTDLKENADFWVTTSVILNGVYQGCGYPLLLLIICFIIDGYESDEKYFSKLSRRHERRKVELLSTAASVIW